MRTKPDTTETIKLGSFTVKSSRLIVSDPTYTEQFNVLSKVKRGKWDVDVQLTERDGKTVVKALTIVLQGGKPDLLVATKRWVQSLTGLAGYFDYSMDDGIVEPKLSSKHGGVFDTACIANCGHGAFECWYFTDKDGFVVRSTIIFVQDYGVEDEVEINNFGIKDDGFAFLEGVEGYCPICYDFHDVDTLCSDIPELKDEPIFDNTEYLTRSTRYDY